MHRVDMVAAEVFLVIRYTIALLAEVMQQRRKIKYRWMAIPVSNYPGVLQACCKAIQILVSSGFLTTPMGLQMSLPVSDMNLKTEMQ